MALYDLEITDDGRLRSYPQTAPTSIQVDLELVSGRSPITLVTSLTDYRRLAKLFNHAKCLMSEEARDAIERALEAGKTVARPITKPTDFELLAYVEEVRELKCIKDVNMPSTRGDNGIGFAGLELTAGKKYEFKSKKIQFAEPFTKPKFTYDESTNTIGTREHQMSFKGHDYALEFVDDRGWTMRFRDHPTIHTDIDERKIWDYFERPDIPTLASDHRDKYDAAMDVLRYMESAARPQFSFYPGQMKYVASASCSDSALIAAETGCGKTLIAISLIMLKAPARALICAPKGTVHTSDAKVHAQWVSEFKKFAPTIPVHKLFTDGDYRQLLEENGGELPYGVFLTYDHAMFRTGLEHVPTSWVTPKKVNGKTITPDTEGLYREHLNKLGHKMRPVTGAFGQRCPNKYHYGIGEDRTMNVRDHMGKDTGEKINIRCISEPCLATEIGLELWDMVIFDEAHALCNLDAQITKNFIRLQPKYRYALTATPIPNVIQNIFSLMGWLSVPYWYYGDRSNKHWPYKIDELSGRNGFVVDFVTQEIDHTQHQMNLKNGGRGPRPVKSSPKISQQAKLLKLLRPKLAFIPKDRCNPNLPKLNVMKILVPMSREQRMNYSHYMDPSKVVTRNKQFRYGTQLQYLRGICCQPKTCGSTRKAGSYNIHSGTNYTPKTHAILENAFEIMSKGEQVLIACSQTEQTNEFARRLDEAKIKYSIIDGSVKDKAKQASDFKSGVTQVMLMSIGCAQSLSFEQCSNMIIASLEWSYGKFNQAVGRCYRVNSPKPVNCYVYLHKDSLDELMFDKLCTKQDAATICLYGDKVNNDVINVSDASVLAGHLQNWQALKGAIELSEETESDLLAKWSKLLDKLKTITTGKELGITKDDQDAVSALLEEMEDYV